MGLDIYVGSLTRYYAGDWETILQQIGRTEGMNATTIRATPQPLDRVTDPIEIQRAVDIWRQHLTKGLTSELPNGISWDERAVAPYFTDKPGWKARAALILLAAHAARPGHPRQELKWMNVQKDPAYQSLEADRFVCPFQQVFQPELCLPCDFPFTFRTLDVSGNESVIGSSIELLKQLRELNAATYKASEAQLQQWKHDGPSAQDNFEQESRFGLAIFLHHAQLSVEHRLPMKLDY